MEINWFCGLVSDRFSEYEKFNKFQEDYEEAWGQAAIEVLIDLMPTEFDANSQDEDGETILMYLAEAGDVSLVKWLVEEKKADVNALTYDETEFALYNAARKGWQDIFDYLAPLTNPELRAIAEQSLPSGLVYRARKQNKPVENFIESARSGKLEQVIAAISEGIDVNAIGSDNEAALHKACWFKQRLVIEALLKAGANPNILDEIKFWTPLIHFTRNIEHRSTENDIAILRMLIAAGADVNIKGGGDSTPLTWAKIRKNQEIIQLLLEAGASED